MLTSFLLFLCRISPMARRAAWRWWYGKLAREVGTGSWTFMNYGYSPSDVASGLALKPDDEPDRFCVQLYERVIKGTSLSGAEVLEVGSGRGGGSSYLARYHQPKKMTGIDFSREAIAFCQRRHGAISNLQFLHGDAERQPFSDASFDVVVNVESSHCYGDVEKFFREVIRVLRPGGRFAFADLRTTAEMEELRAMLVSQTGWELVEEEDITHNVAAALRADDLRKRKMIEEHVSAKLQPIFHEFAGVEGGKIFQGLTKRELIYSRFVMRRSDHSMP